LRRRALKVASQALKQAVRWRMLASNPATAVTPPRVPRSEIHPLTPEQVLVFLDAALEDRVSALYCPDVGTGMRHGELLGLWWEDVDLAGACIHVRRQLHESNGGKLWIGEVKTAKARRRIDLPMVVVEALRDHRQRMMAEGHAPHRNALVFCDTHGG